MSAETGSSRPRGTAKTSTPAAKKATPKQAPAKATRPKAPGARTPAAKTGATSRGVTRAESAKGASAKKVPETAAPAPAKTAKKSTPATATRQKAPAAPPTAQDVKKSKPWKRARKRAEGVLSDPERMRKIAQEASEKSQGRRSGPLSDILDQVSALIRLVAAYARGHYRDVSAQTMITVVAGLIYFVSPVDLVPDFLPGGFLDDAAVLTWVIRSVKQELDAFMEWEVGQEA